MGLPATSTVAYNGITFPSPLTHLRISSRSVFDDAQRTIKYVSYTLELEAVLASGNAGTSFTVAAYQQKLQEPGRRLTVSNTGFFEVDTQLFNADVEFGPKPRLLSWEPLGAHLAARVFWVCEFAISPCVLGELNVSYPGIPGGTGQLAAFNYVVGYSISADGLSARSVTGFLETWLDRINGSRLTSRTADDYRFLIKPTVPLGFRRVRQEFTLSQDRRRLDFAIVDEEIDSDRPLAGGAVQMQVRQRVGADAEKKGGMNVWDGEFTGTIKIDRGRSQSDAWVIFLITIRERLKWIKDHSFAGGGVMLLGLEFDEEIFGRTASFALRYRQFTTLDGILEASGLWQSVPGTDWGLYRTSLQQAWSERGHAQLRYNPGQDVIIDLCGGEGNVQEESYALPPAQPPLPPPRQALGVSCPPREASFIDYDNRLMTRWSRKTMIHQMLKTGTIPAEVGAPGAFADNANRAKFPSMVANDKIFQKGLPTFVEVVMMGRAVRFGYPIPRPRFHDVPLPGLPDVVFHESSERDTFSQRVIGKSGDCKIYEAHWRMSYFVEGDMTGKLIPIAPNHQVGGTFIVDEEPLAIPLPEPIQGGI